MFHPWIEVIYILLVSQHGSGDEASEEDSILQKLDLVFGIFRHGDRAPLMTYPNDTNRQSELWSLGLGELTHRGIQTMLKLGKYLKHRYGKFLNDDPKATYVRSSPKPRCFNSAAFVLYELYPAKKPRKFKGSKKWFPFPITRVPEGHDKYTLVCLTEIKRMAQRVLNLTGEFAGMALFLVEAAQQLGLELPKNAAAMPDALDAVLVQIENGLQVPPWFEQRISTLNYTSRGLYILMAHAFIKNMGGQFLRCTCGWCEAMPTIVERVCCREIPAATEKQPSGSITMNVRFHTLCLDDVVLDVVFHTLQDHGVRVENTRDIALFLEEKYNPTPGNLKKDPLTPGQDKSRREAKLHLFSYHDLNIIAALMALDSTFSEKPYYGSLVTFEVWRKVEAYITVYYRYGTERIKMFNIPGCSYPCKVNNFIVLVRQKFPIDFTPQVCGYPQGYVVL